MAFILTFLEGVASFISPCILPMLPIYISYFAGEDNKKSKAVINSIAFVIGFSVIFVLLSIIANRVGNVFFSNIKTIKIIFGILIIVLGLSYIDIIKINIFSKFKRFKADVNNLNFIKSFIFGVLFSISVTPCVGTFLSSAILLIASKESLFEGILLMVLYCIGMGIPFVISAFLIDRCKNVFSFIKNNYKVVKVISGAILIIMGLYIIFL